jgi:hypothetical protein
VILTPCAILVQLTSVAVGIVKFQIHPDPTFGFFDDLNRVVPGVGLSVDSKDALRRKCRPLAQEWKRTYCTDNTAGNREAPRCTMIAKHS